MKNHELINNREENSFEFHIDDEIAHIDYSLTPNGEIALTHTGIPTDLRGNGIGTKLVEAVLDYCEKENLKVIPLCGFVISYIKEHPQWKRVVLEGVMV